MTDGGYWSAKSFSQAEMPFGFAFRLYDAFSAAVQRNSTRSVALSLVGRGGLPLPRFGLSMGLIMPVQIILDKPYPEAHYVSVHLINQRKRTMSAKDLIEMASKNGYSVGRNHSKSYRYGATVDGKHVEATFNGTWAEFCKLMKGLCK